jgi:hypothetical protein
VTLTFSPEKSQSSAQNRSRHAPFISDPSDFPDFPNSIFKTVLETMLIKQFLILDYSEQEIHEINET